MLDYIACSTGNSEQSFRFLWKKSFGLINVIKYLSRYKYVCGICRTI